MKMIKLSVVAVGLLLSGSLLTDAYAALPPSVGNVFPNDDEKNLIGTLVQQNEGIPHPDSHGRCVMVNRPVVGASGRLLGYQTINVCN